MDDHLDRRIAGRRERDELRRDRARELRVDSP
jgi:hypothetical protein